MYLSKGKSSPGIPYRIFCNPTAPHCGQTKVRNCFLRLEVAAMPRKYNYPVTFTAELFSTQIPLIVRLTP